MIRSKPTTYRLSQASTIPAPSRTTVTSIVGVETATARLVTARFHKSTLLVAFLAISARTYQR